MFVTTTPVFVQNIVSVCFRMVVLHLNTPFDTPLGKHVCRLTVLEKNNRLQLFPELIVLCWSGNYISGIEQLNLEWSGNAPKHVGPQYCQPISKKTS